MNFKARFGNSTEAYIPENLLLMRETTRVNTLRVNVICKAIIASVFLLLIRIGTADLISFSGITYDAKSVPIRVSDSRER